MSLQERFLSAPVPQIEFRGKRTLDSSSHGRLPMRMCRVKNSLYRCGENPKLCSDWLGQTNFKHFLEAIQPFLSEKGIILGFEHYVRSYVLFKNMLLYRKGLHLNNYDNINDSTKMTICDCCMCDLKKEKSSPFSAGNKMWISDVPLVLKDLTIPKMILIARYRHNNCIIKLTSFSNDANSAQSALKGNVVTFVQHLSHIAKT
jgi:hypothetical protein